MIDLSKFPKLGVRVPVALRRLVKRAVCDLDEAKISFDGDDMTMEAVFAAATLHLLSMPQEEMFELFRKRMPDLEGMFEAEMPGVAPAKGEDQAGNVRDARGRVVPASKSGGGKRGPKKSAPAGEGG